MYKAVNEGGTGRIAMVPGLDICGKTGTAQNPHGADHSTFFCFGAPQRPENRRLGLCRERPLRRDDRRADRQPAHGTHLTDTITRPALVDYVKNMQIAYPYYEKQRKGK